MSHDFDQKVIALLPLLRRKALRLTYNEENARDLVQETMLKAFANVEQFRPGTSLRAWLKMIMVNNYRDMRRRGRIDRLTDSMESMSTTTSARWRQPEDVLTEQEASYELNTLLAVMRQREPLYAEALIMVRGFGVSYSEYARQTHVPTGTVKRRLNEAMRRLEQAGVILKRRPGRGSRYARIAKGSEHGASGATRGVTSNTDTKVLQALRKL